MVDKTDDNWREYLTYLGFPTNSSLQDAEMNSTDIHRYAFGRHNQQDMFHFWHEIPATKFSLEFYVDTNFTAKTIDDWEPNPYPAVTPAGFTPSLQAALTKWKNTWGPSAHIESPSAQDPFWRDAGCSRAIRTDMLVGKGKNEIDVVSFWRELLEEDPNVMLVTLYVYRLKADRSGPDFSKPLVGPAYRYFRKKCTVSLLRGAPTDPTLPLQSQGRQQMYELDVNMYC